MADKFYVRNEAQHLVDAGIITDSGVKQVETATVAGTISKAGNVKVTITSKGVSQEVLVPVALSDTATIVAGKIRDELARYSDIVKEFTISGTGTSVVLTKNVEEANDSTLNISVINGTSEGLTNATTSANTTAGVKKFISQLTDKGKSKVERVYYQLPFQDRAVLKLDASEEIHLAAFDGDGELDEFDTQADIKETVFVIVDGVATTNYTVADGVYTLGTAPGEGTKNVLVVYKTAKPLDLETI